MIEEHNKVHDKDGKVLDGSDRMSKLKLKLKHNSSSYIEKQRYGGVGHDQSDSEEENEKETVKQTNPDMTPMTQRAK